MSSKAERQNAPDTYILNINNAPEGFPCTSQKIIETGTQLKQYKEQVEAIFCLPFQSLLSFKFYYQMDGI